MTDVLPFGDRGLLLRVPDRSQVLNWYADLQANPVTGQQDLVPGDGTLLVLVGYPGQRALAIAEIHLRPDPQPIELSSGSEVALRVVYDGPDLAEVAGLLGTSGDEVVARHTGQMWTVAFTGFAPGFGYLVGDDGGLDVPRLPSPRTRVPAGAVALAAGYSAVYPRASPGGWQLIGRSDAALWDLGRHPPALLMPGTRVRFRAVRELVDIATAEPSAPPLVTGPGLRVDRPGPLTLPIDEGRPGFAHLGVPCGGAADRRAYRAANVLAGNPADAVALEVTLGGLVVTAIGDQRLAVAGADATLTVRGRNGDRAFAGATSFLLLDGERLTVGTARSGLRSYVAVAGGLDLPPVLGSRSFDILSRLGPQPVARGDLLPVGLLSVSAVTGRSHYPVAGTDEAPPSDGESVRATRASEMPAHGTRAGLAVTPGPAPLPGALTQLLDKSWTVTPQSNRIGLRLGGAAIGWTPDTEPRSAPLVPGAIQLPPSGEPVVFLRDHPTTGGYPVIAVLTENSIDLAAQLRPGDTVTFGLAPAPGRGSSPGDQ